MASSSSLASVIPGSRKPATRTSWDVTEKDTPPVKIWWLGRKAGFRKIKVYPHPGNTVPGDLFTFRVRDATLPEVSVVLDRRA